MRTVTERQRLDVPNHLRPLPRFCLKQPKKSGYGPALRPFCAVDHPDHLQENVSAVVRAFLQPVEVVVPVVLTFDETYLWQRYDATSLEGDVVVVGGVWPQTSVIKVPGDSGVDTLDHNKARKHC